jgi:hypothetical protein
MNNELGKICKETVMILFEILSLNLRGTEGNADRPSARISGVSAENPTE